MPPYLCSVRCPPTLWCVHVPRQRTETGEVRIRSTVRTTFVLRQGEALDQILWFATGIVLLSLPMGALIRRYTAKTTLVASLFGYALTVSAMPYLHSYEAIACVRLTDGACSVGVWVSSETILLQRAGPSHKAYVTILYAVTVALGYLTGPLVARGLVAVAPFAVGFTVAGVVALLASVYVASSLDRDMPNLPEAESVTPSRLGAQFPLTCQ